MHEPAALWDITFLRLLVLCATADFQNSENRLLPHPQMQIPYAFPVNGMGHTCKSKQLFWTVLNSIFQKLYLRWKFVKWPPLFGQQTWWGNEPGWWRKLWSTIPDRSLGTQGTPNVEDPAKANKFWATIHTYIYKKTHLRNRDGFAIYVGICIMYLLWCRTAYIIFSRSVNLKSVHLHPKQTKISDLASKLYTPSTLNIDLILWHTHLIVCAVK